MDLIDGLSASRGENRNWAIFFSGKKIGDKISETEFVKVLSKKIQGQITLSPEESSEMSVEYKHAGLYEKVCFVCCFFVFNHLKKYSTHMDTLPLPVKDCTFELLLSNFDYWALRVLYFVACNKLDFDTMGHLEINRDFFSFVIPLFSLDNCKVFCYNFIGGEWSICIRLYVIKRYKTHLLRWLYLNLPERITFSETHTLLQFFCGSHTSFDFSHFQYLF